MTRTAELLQEIRRMRFKESLRRMAGTTADAGRGGTVAGGCVSARSGATWDRYEDEGFLQCSASRSGLRPGRPCRHRCQCRRVRRIRARRSALVSRLSGNLLARAHGSSQDEQGARSLPRRRGRVLPEGSPTRPGAKAWSPPAPLGGGRRSGWISSRPIPKRAYAAAAEELLTRGG